MMRFDLVKQPGLLIVLLLILVSTACQSAAPPSSSIDSSSKSDMDTSNVKTIIVGVFQQADNGNYIDTGKTLVFDAEEEGQTWSHSAKGDEINPETHLHYNAAKNISYENEVFTWTEFGPAHSAAEIDSACATGTNGITKLVSQFNRLLPG